MKAPALPGDCILLPVMGEVTAVGIGLVLAGMCRGGGGMWLWLLEPF